MWEQDFPSGSWLRLHASNARDVGLIPGWGKFTRRTVQPKKENVKRKQNNHPEVVF